MLTPPPVAPAPTAVSFQTTSPSIVPARAVSFVPPHASAYGLDEGKSTCGWASLSPSPEPLSPQATVTVTPRPAASSSALSMAVRAAALQLSSVRPS